MPVRPRISDYVELTKPRIATMALITVAVGYLMGAAPAINGWVLFNTLLGAGLVAAGGSAWNCVLERKADAKMLRTQNRTVPAGRLSHIAREWSSPTDPTGHPDKPSSAHRSD